MTSGVVHVALRVDDLDASLDFYTRILGLEIADRQSVSGAELVFLRHKGAATCDIELVSGRTGHFLGDGVIHHIALGVQDLMTALEKLESSGIEVPQEAIVQVADQLSLFIRGPSGESIQICEVQSNG